MLRAYMAMYLLVELGKAPLVLGHDQRLEGAGGSRGTSNANGRRR